jgi:hypothetical protein
MGAFWHLKHMKIRTYQNSHISQTSQQECHEFKLNLKLTNMTDDFQNFPHSLLENTRPITASSPTHTAFLIHLSQSFYHFSFESTENWTPTNVKLAE